MTASDDIRSVWEFPPKGTLPDLAPLLEARDPEAMAGWIAERHRVFARGVEASHRRTLATLEKDLAAKGIPFEVDRMLGEQAMAAFDDMEDAVFDLDEPEAGWAFRTIPSP